MDIHALQQIVHSTRDARRKQTLPKFPPAERDQLIHKFHPDYRASAYRPIRFGPNKGDQTVIELATLLEGDSPIQEDQDLAPAYESFYDARRPFFVAGHGMFRFNVNCSPGNFNGENLDYSRRIGSTPTLARTYGDNVPLQPTTNL